MGKSGSAPSWQFMLTQFQKSAYITDIPTNYICLISAIWEDPGDGARLRRYAVTWYNAAGTGTTVQLPDADIPVDRLFTVKCVIEYNGANSTIDLTIDNYKFDTITANFTSMAAIGSVGFGPYNGIHMLMEDAINSYPIYMGKQYIGDVPLSSIPIKQLKHYYTMQEVA